MRTKKRRGRPFFKHKIMMSMKQVFLEMNEVYGMGYGFFYKHIRFHPNFCIHVHKSGYNNPLISRDDFQKFLTWYDTLKEKRD